MLYIYPLIPSRINYDNRDLSKHPRERQRGEREREEERERTKTKTNKETNKNIYNEDLVLKLNCKIGFFVPCKGHQNCLDKYLERVVQSDREDIFG